MREIDRFLITGSDGMIGKAIPFGIKSCRASLDVTDARAINETLDRVQPSGILHLSSYDLKRCEDDPFNAYRTNVLSVGFMCEAAARLNIPLVIVSTAALFNGPLGTKFDELAEPNPVNHYGLTKYLAERMVKSILNDYLIVRTGWLFGGSGAHFVNFVERFIEQAFSAQPLQASADHEGSPTYLLDFVDSLQRLIKDGEVGTWHVVNDGHASAFDIASEIVAFAGNITSVEKVESRSLSKVSRSASEVLSSSKLKLRDWRGPLQEYLKLKKGRLTE